MLTVGSRRADGIGGMTADSSSPTRAGRLARRRLWGVRLAATAASAAALGLTPAELSARQRTAPLERIASERGVGLGEVGEAAVRAAEPLLQEAVVTGALTARQGDAIRLRLRTKGLR
jgi:hypothetical protein